MRQNQDLRNLNEELKIKNEQLSSEMDDLTTAAKLNKMLKMGKKINIGTLEKEDGTFTETPTETLDLLLRTHFPNKDDDDRNTNNINNLDQIIEQPDNTNSSFNSDTSNEGSTDNDENIINEILVQDYRTIIIIFH